MLGRRRRKDVPTEATSDDRDKTLEPEKPLASGFSNPLSRSATTILSSTSSAKKERTPYRLHRNYSDRKPTVSGVGSTAYTSVASKSRPELSLMHSSTSAAIPKTSYYETPASESLYDPYGGAYGYSSAYTSRLPTSTASRYNDYDHLGLSNGPGTYGYYEGRDKENTYKSKYEPSRLYAELTNNGADTSFGRGDDRDRSKRFQKAYRRTATAHDTRPMVSGYRDYDNDIASSTSRYGPRKSLGGYQRSQTQKFFDSEKSSVLRSLNDDAINNNSVDGYGVTSDEIKTEAMKEREARRKEIQGLIAKYAQIDDVYNRAIDNEPASSSNHNDIGASAACASSTVHNSRGRLYESKATDIDNSLNGALGLGLSAYGTQHQPHSSFLPLSKTQSAATMSSVSRSRIPKTFSTFVRAKEPPPIPPQPLHTHTHTHAQDLQPKTVKRSLERASWLTKAIVWMFSCAIELGVVVLFSCVCILRVFLYRFTCAACHVLYPSTE